MLCFGMAMIFINLGNKFNCFVSNQNLKNDIKLEVIVFPEQKKKVPGESRRSMIDVSFVIIF